MEQYTEAEVALNDGSNGSRVWIVIWGTVYDVTDYMDGHPGGPELITEFAGMDATEGFDDFGHSSDAKKMLKKYEIGQLVKSENGKNRENNNGISKARNTKQRRKFLTMLVGKCASS